MIKIRSKKAATKLSADVILRFVRSEYISSTAYDGHNQASPEKSRGFRPGLFLLNGLRYHTEEKMAGVINERIACCLFRLMSYW